MLKITRILNKLINFIYFFTRFRNIQFAYLFANQDATKHIAQHVSILNNQILFKATNNRLDLKTAKLFKTEIHKLVAVLNFAKTKVVSVDDTYFILEIDKVIYKVETQNNLNILHEIYIEFIYNIVSAEKNIIVLDIGMNIGFASLFFAAQKNVEKVFGFEPFPNTYHLAVSNFESNVNLKNKIYPNNFGISNHNETIEVPVSEAGSVSFSTDSDFIKNNNNSNLTSIKVAVQNISTVLLSIINKYPSNPIYLKIDCEGEEYKILEELSKTSLLSKISCLIIEWHFKGPEELNGYLLTNGFSLHEVPIHDQNNYGMIYAFNTGLIKTVI